MTITLGRVRAYFQSGRNEYSEEFISGWKCVKFIAICWDLSYTVIVWRPPLVLTDKLTRLSFFRLGPKFSHPYLIFYIFSVFQVLRVIRLPSFSIFKCFIYWFCTMQNLNVWNQTFAKWIKAAKLYFTAFIHFAILLKTWHVRLIYAIKYLLLTCLLAWRRTQPPTLSDTGNKYRPMYGDAVRLGSKGRMAHSFHMCINV